MAVLHGLEEVSPRRRLNVVEFRASNHLRVDEPFVVRAAKLGKDAEGFDVRALRGKRAPYVARLALQPFTSQPREVIEMVSRGTSPQTESNASAATAMPRENSSASRFSTSRLIGSRSPSQTAATIRAPSCVNTSPDRRVEAASGKDSHRITSWYARVSRHLAIKYSA